MHIIKHIREYLKKPKILFTTPSHDGGEYVSPEALKLLGLNYFEADFSEIDGFDNLAEPSGIIKDSQNETAEIYGAHSAFYLTNGSTSGVIAAMLAVLNKGSKVLIARNCHRCVYNGLVLSGAVPIWLMPAYNKEWDIYEGINPLALEKVLNDNPDIKAFIVTNPTYEGYMSDISEISNICASHDVILIVDEAHGALWNFMPSIGTPSIKQGADIVIQSLHKTAGAINPAALLLTGSDKVGAKKIKDALNLITTSSPSYPVMADIEATVEYLASKKGQNYLKSFEKSLNKFLNELSNIPDVSVYENDNDITKILVKINGMSGHALADELYESFNIECEYSNAKSVLFLTGAGTTNDKFKQLLKAIKKIASYNSDIYDDYEIEAPSINIRPKVRCTPAVVWGRPSKEIDIHFAVSRISMEMIANYPPGIPVLLPGEVIRKEHIEFLKDRKTIKVLM